MNLRSFTQLRRSAFSGFDTVAHLRTDHLAGAPEHPGVYLILWPDRAAPRFLLSSPAGHRKGRDPTLAVAALRAAWVRSSKILYIGKAGGPGLRSTLRSRLRAYLSHGRGRQAGHWGGRAIWQLRRSDELLVAWRVERRRRPRDVERELIALHVAQHGALPFANRAR